MEKILRLQRLGRNYWGNIAYEDKESGKYTLTSRTVILIIRSFIQVPHPMILTENRNFPITTKYEIVNPITKEEKLQEKLGTST